MAPVRLQVRALVSALVKDAVPASWKNGLVQAAMGAASWVDDLGKRIVHLESVSKPGAKSGPDASPYWLGGLFSPDAFVTASRQHVARALSCSLEELKLSLVVGPAEENSAGEGDSGCRVLAVFRLPALWLSGSTFPFLPVVLQASSDSVRFLWLLTRSYIFVASMKRCYDSYMSTWFRFWCIDNKELHFR